MQSLSNAAHNAGTWLSSNLIPEWGEYLVFCLLCSPCLPPRGTLNFQGQVSTDLGPMSRVGEPRQGFPKRKDGSIRYMPWIGAGCFAFMLLGIGLWVHYTNAVFYYAKHGFQILGIDQLLIYNTAFNLTRVYTSLTATAIVYLIFGLMIVILGTWRGWQALDQDLNGRVYDNQAGLTMFMIFILQIVWFLIMLWLVLLMMGDAVFVAWIYVVKGGLYSSIRAQFWAQNQWTPTPYQNPYTCPATCYNANGIPFFGLLDSNGRFQRGGCICDWQTLTDANAAFVSAYSNSAAAFVGIFFMQIYGSFLSYYLSSMWSRTRCEMDMFQRISNNKE